MRSIAACLVVSTYSLGCHAEPAPEPPEWVEEGPLIEWSEGKFLQAIPTEAYELALAQYEADPALGLVLPVGEVLDGRLPPDFTPEVQAEAVEFLIRQDEGGDATPETGCRLAVHAIIHEDSETILAAWCVQEGCVMGEFCDKITMTRRTNLRVFCACVEGRMFDADPAAPKSTCHLEMRSWIREGRRRFEFVCDTPCEEPDRSCEVVRQDRLNGRTGQFFDRISCECREVEGGN